jgi:hypothetical protein
MGHFFGIIIYFFLGGALLNFNNVITRKDFIIIKTIMIAHYIKKSFAKENTPFDVTLYDYKVYLFEIIFVKIVLKNTNIFQKQYKRFKTKFMRVEDTLNHVYKPCENFNKFHFKIIFV